MSVLSAVSYSYQAVPKPGVLELPVLLTAYILI